MSVQFHLDVNGMIYRADFFEDDSTSPVLVLVSTGRCRDARKDQFFIEAVLESILCEPKEILICGIKSDFTGLHSLRLPISTIPLMKSILTAFAEENFAVDGIATGKIWNELWTKAVEWQQYKDCFLRL